MSLRRILVLSLGNKGQYSNTYHSAGHLVLDDLQPLLGPEQPPFTVQRVGGKSALASIGPRYVLLQSPTLMNVSGPWVAQAVREEGRGDAESVGVVLVHDDLEEQLGVVKTRDWNRSHRGHNGIKSVNQSLRWDPSRKWARVSVGIGRPEARGKTEVSDFVLSKVSPAARDVLRTKGARGVLAAIDALEQKWEE